LEYRIKTRLSRAHAFSLGASLTLAGFVSSCEQGGGPVYGAPCNPPSCSPPVSGGNAGAPTHGGAANVGGVSGAPGSSGSLSGGTAGMGGSTGGSTAAGAAGDAGGAAGATDPGGAGGEVAGGAGGAGGELAGGASGQAGEGGQPSTVVGAPVTVLLGGSQDAAVQLGGTLTVTIQLPSPAQADTALAVATTSGVVPATVTVATGSSLASFQYTPVQEGSHQISTTLAADTSIVNVLVTP